jgi:anti-sigma B factor antagonist
MSLAARVERRGTAAIVSLSGELDIAAETQAQAALERAMDGAAMLVADLRELDFLDSTGVRVLITAHLRATERGVEFGVVRGGGMVARLLEVTRIDQRFPVVDDPAELLAGPATGPANGAQWRE